ncbi:MAG: imidazoleglycerol-phosphate dehydratase HisB [Coriobacteriales bacterium]|nr:imidazoleglycerol-phosphate dehydratase HisB [Coriobacteriales bacterium]
MRTAHVERQTAETQIEVSLNLDGTGAVEVDTGIGFFDHMLSALGRHSLIDLSVKAAGDLEVDGHHTVEDTGIVIGQALREALGDKAGIHRYGSAVTPMDEALVLCALDISGRGAAFDELQVSQQMLGSFDTDLAREFFIALAANAGITLHLRQLAGRNAHHVLEGAFKALAQALRQAVELDPRRAGEVPSTKGTL